MSSDEANFMDGCHKRMLYLSENVAISAFLLLKATSIHAVSLRFSSTIQ